MSKPTRYSYDSRHKYTIKNIDRRFVEETADGCIFQRVEGTLIEAFTRQQMAELIQAGEVEIVHNFYTLGGARLHMTKAPENINDLRPEIQDQILYRNAWCDTWFKRKSANPRDVSRSDRSLAKFILETDQTFQANGLAYPYGRKPTQKPKAGKISPSSYSPPSPKTLRSWLGRYEACGYSPMALLPLTHRCGNRDRRLDPRVQSSMHNLGKKYCDERRLSISSCFEEHKKDIQTINDSEGLCLRAASRNTFYGYINSLDKFEVEAGRRGIEAAKKKFYISKGGIEVLRPFQRVEIDHWSVQLHTLNIDPEVLDLLSAEERATLGSSRIYLCVSLDCASRAIPGLSASMTPNTQNAINTLRLTVSDKTWIAHAVGAQSSWGFCGTPEVIVSDGGPEFIDFQFRAAGIGLGIDMQLARGGNPQLRARIERIFGTINRQALQAFTGRTFANIVDLGDYPAEKRASLTAQELLDAMVRYVVDEYHNSNHGGLLGETPANAWRRLTDEFACPAPPGPNKLRSIFGIPLRRAVGTNGVRVLGLWFQSDLIQKHRYQFGDGVTIDIKVDPEDLGAISVLIDSAWHAVRCRTKSMRRVSIATWMATRADLRAKFAEQAKLTEHIVRKAVHDREVLHQRAIQRARLSPTTLTQEQLDRAEHEMFRGLDILPEEDSDPLVRSSASSEFHDFLLTDVIPVAPSAAPPPQEPLSDDATPDAPPKPQVPPSIVIEE